MLPKIPPVSIRNNGFSLIEILVSVFVLALGLLGLASLQIASLQFNHQAQQRSIALAQITEMADRMRANMLAVQGGSYHNASGVPSLPSCTTCTPAQIATKDIHLWNTENANLLPSGQGQISHINGNVFDITLRWDSQRTGATGTDCSNNAGVDLTCIIMRIEL